MASQNGYLTCQIQIWIPSKPDSRSQIEWTLFMEGESRQWRIQDLQMGAKVDMPKRVGRVEGYGTPPQIFFPILGVKYSLLLHSGCSSMQSSCLFYMQK